MPGRPGNRTQVVRPVPGSLWVDGPCAGSLPSRTPSPPRVRTSRRPPARAITCRMASDNAPDGPVRGAGVRVHTLCSGVRARAAYRRDMARDHPREGSRRSCPNGMSAWTATRRPLASPTPSVKSSRSTRSPRPRAWPNTATTGRQPAGRTSGARCPRSSRCSRRPARRARCTARSRRARSGRRSPRPRACS